jgi:DNA modification methylase
MRVLDFKNIKVSPEWCFKNTRSVEQWTHGYHRYPAKFLPNVVKKLIEEYTSDNDVIVDIFAGCGTTLVEAKIHGRESIGVDINPVAELITRVKTTPIEPEIIQEYFSKILNKIDLYTVPESRELPLHKRIDYWFEKENKNKISFLYQQILFLENEIVRDFFLVSLSHILKNCSKWLQSSTKPQIDKEKKTADPFIIFRSHTKNMVEKNKEFYNYLAEKQLVNIKCEIKLEDARTTSIESESADMIVTSPPYVTSYEYADIHQLTGYWFEYIEDLLQFRKKFIGTFYSKNERFDVELPIAAEIVNEIKAKDERMAKEVANYFFDVHKVVQEMNRILKNNGRTCIVVGDTTFRGIKIKSAEVWSEMLKNNGFQIERVIKRSIPSKLIPTIRDERTGRFTTLKNENSKKVYPEEYILIAKKQCHGKNHKR